MNLYRKFLLAFTKFALRIRPVEDCMYFASLNGKFIYFVVIGEMCKSEAHFHQIFPESIKVTEKRYNRLMNKNIEVILVADGRVVDELEPPESTSLKLSE